MISTEEHLWRINRIKYPCPKCGFVNREDIKDGLFENMPVPPYIRKCTNCEKTFYIYKNDHTLPNSYEEFCKLEQKILIKNAVKKSRVL